MEKKLLTGNEAIARGAFESGVTVGTAYPGTPSTEILENLAKYPDINCNWSANEKVALEVAIGASLEGARVMAVMKHVGVNVAADPLLTLSYTGVNGGFILISADDPGMHSSQNEQDNRHYASFAKIPFLEPSDSQEAKDYVAAGLEISEKYDTPVMIRSTTRISHSRTIVNIEEPKKSSVSGFKKDIAKYVMLPGFARARHPIIEERLLKLEKESENSPLNIIEENDTEIGVICSGVAYNYVKEALPHASVLKLGFPYPLPKEKIRSFCNKVKKVYVIEELDPFLEEKIKALGIEVTGKELFPLTGELSGKIIAETITGKETDLFQIRENLPARPPILCPGCSHRGVFYTLKKLKLNVTGDIGCYTLGALPPLSSMDTCICMGASIGVALGMEKANPDVAANTVAVIGDSTFFHSGITPLLDIVYSGAATTVIIVDNSTTGMTGHQDHPGTGKTLKGDITNAVNLKSLCLGLGVKRVVEANPFHITKLEEIIKEELSAKEPSVIIASYPCALKEKSFSESLWIDTDKCNGCKKCLKIGCPAMSFKDKKVAISPNICTGCKLCMQLCKYGAIN